MREGMSLYGLRDAQLFIEQSCDTKMIMAWNPTTIVMSFRGTASRTAAFYDMQVLLLQHSNAWHTWPCSCTPCWPTQLQISTSMYVCIPLTCIAVCITPRACACLGWDQRMSGGCLHALASLSPRIACSHAECRSLCCASRVIHCSCVHVGVAGSA